MAEQNEKQNEEQYMEQDKKRKEKERIKRADEAFVRDHEERMAMLRYLIDIVGLDVNADDKPPGAPYIHMRWGTPMNYLMIYTDVDKDTRDIMCLLLGRGAYPTPVYKSAEGCNYWPDSTTLLLFEHVEAWKKARKSKNECCVQ